MKACDTADVQMIESCITCGAWMDFVLPRDTAGNTPLHLVVIQCQEHEEYLAEAARLGLEVDEHTGKCDMESSLAPANEEERRQILDEIVAWKKKHENDLKAVQLLVNGYADPLLANAEGKTPLEMAKEKDPAIVEILEDGVAALDALRERARQEDQGVA